MKPFKASVLAAAAVLAGCGSAPNRLGWDAAIPVLTPAETGPHGSLRVETPRGNGHGDDVENHHGFFLYGEDGAFLDRFPNPYAHPVRVRPGRYIVVGEGLPGLRKVQVEVKEDLITHVRLNDLMAGKEVD